MDICDFGVSFATENGGNNGGENGDKDGGEGGGEDDSGRDIGKGGFEDDDDVCRMFGLCCKRWFGNGQTNRPTLVRWPGWW